MNTKISQIIANELHVKPQQVLSAITLLDEGSTVPFIARYRKEVTGSLDDSQLRQLEVRLVYLREMEDRRQTILKSIEEQGNLTDELQKVISQVTNKTELEDLYLPYKPKRRTRGQIAIAAGLEPLADRLWQDPSSVPEVLATTFINDDVPDHKAALDGARYILMERFAEDAGLLATIRHYLWNNATLISKVIEGKDQEGIKFKDYFDYQEAIATIPSHRALALFRGRNEGILQLSLNADPLEEETTKESYCEHLIKTHLQVNIAQAPADNWRKNVISWTWKIKILLHMETELLSTLREQAEQEAINVFARNLRDLLMAAPAGMRVTMGMDPGLRTGVKIAVVDETGKLLDTATVYPHTGKQDKAIDIVAALCLKYHVQLVAIGNGTASRETERFFLATKKKYPQIQAEKVMVSEAGASVYSASELAANEFPELDVSLRGAVSIARRLQDPLAELVKIDPKSIGVGQYQHDVSQMQLARRLDTVVEDCVNRVGVDLNTASEPLLARVSGLTKIMAHNIVKWRNKYGQFMNRQQLLSVSRLGPKAFEQCAGFLRITNGDNPLDASGVHPESYSVVEQILTTLKYSLKDVMCNVTVLANLDPNHFSHEHVGTITVKDILEELKKPGRDPRPEFKTAAFEDGIETIDDLKIGLILEGTVTNVTNFGAFVDIGVHQDGLVHISAMSEKYIDDPHLVVKTGDIVKVKVMDIDITRKRIALSMCLADKTNTAEDKKKRMLKLAVKKEKNSEEDSTVMQSAFSAALKQHK